MVAVPSVRARYRSRAAACALALAGVALLLAACGGSGIETEEFELEASDGFRFVAEVARTDDSAPEVWVLLGHQFTGDRTDYDSLREELLELDRTVMTWDFRCHGESPCETETKGDSVPEIWREWEAALDYAVAQGATTIYAAGSSMGGTSLIQVAADRDDITAIAAVTSPNRFKGLDALASYEQFTVPKFFVAGRGDNWAPVYSRRYHERATGPSRLVILETELHGTTLLQDEEWGPESRELVVSFLADPATAVLLPSVDPGPIPGGPGDEEAAADVDSGEADADSDDDAAVSGLADEEVAEEEDVTQPAPGEVPDTTVVDVTLHTDDGLALAANVRPGGPVWVLLGHQLRDERGGWGVLDDQLQSDGYTVLFWDFRDHGDSPNGDVSQITLDWLAAIDHAQDSGAEGIYAVGASMGGTSALVVAASDPRVDGVMTLSAPALFLGLDGASAVREIAVPMVFVAGERDTEALAGMDVFRRAAREVGAEATTVTYPTGLHGNSLVRDEELVRELYGRLLELLPAPDGSAG